jgi:AraC-like DNA-binding protein
LRGKDRSETEETEKSAIEVMCAVVFQTKSDFNREFRRVTEIAPLDWRKKTVSRQ